MDCRSLAPRNLKYALGCASGRGGQGVVDPQSFQQVGERVQRGRLAGPGPAREERDPAAQSQVYRLTLALVQRQAGLALEFLQQDRGPLFGNRRRLSPLQPSEAMGQSKLGQE